MRKAFAVNNKETGEAVVTHAETRNRARSKSHGELFCRYIETRAKRYPCLDDVRDKDKQLLHLVMEHRWWRHCDKCGGRVEKITIKDGQAKVTEDNKIIHLNCDDTWDPIDNQEKYEDELNEIEEFLNNYQYTCEDD